MGARGAVAVHTLAAIWATAGTLGFFVLLLSNVGGLGASFAYGLATVSALPFAQIGWASTAFFVLVMLGIEVHRLASARRNKVCP